MSEKKYKRIGWVVERRNTIKDQWHECIWTCEVLEQEVIDTYNSEEGRGYWTEHRNGLARLKRLYVEVQDAKA